MLGQSLALVAAVAAGSMLVGAFAPQQQGASKQPAAPVAPVPSVAPAVANKPADALAPVAFMSGRWIEMNAEGNREEHWSTPRAGTMLGMFRWDSASGSAKMLEILAITSEGEDVVLRLHHFSPTLAVSGEGDKPMTLKLTEKGERKAVFTPTANADMLTKVVYHCPEPNRLRVSVVLAEGGSLEFDLKREGK